MSADSTTACPNAKGNQSNPIHARRKDFITSFRAELSAKLYHPEKRNPVHDILLAVILEHFYLGCLAHASYLLGSEGEGVVIDPQRDVEVYLLMACESATSF